MLDSEGRIVVSNQRLSQLMGLLSGQLKGLSLRCLLERSVEASLISEVNVRTVLDRVNAKLSGIDDAGLELDMQSGQVLEFTLQHMDNGGFVLLAEDVTERKAAEAEKDRLARFNSLTGLPNRNSTARANGARIKRMPSPITCALFTSSILTSSSR